MKASRLAGVFLIFIGVCIAWAILGASVSIRTNESFSNLRAQVAGLWGSPIQQQAPVLTVTETFTVTDDKGKSQTKTERHSIVPESSDIKVNLTSDARRKGLLWHRTYEVEFNAVYTVKHSLTRQPELNAKFIFPSDDAVYDDFEFSVNGKSVTPDSNLNQGLSALASLPPGDLATIKLHYKSRGLDSWTYLFDSGVSQVKNFNMIVSTDFPRYDFPARSLSPTDKRQTASGWELTWQFTNLISGFTAGVEMPEQINPGEIISRITFFAPVGLLFFLAVVVIIGLMKGRNLHPMHYFFVGGAFFSFHLLMAYLADHLDLRLTFLISAVVSVLLVATYLIRAIGTGFSLKVVAPAQLIFLILFSYAFFFKGYTGLTITIASILTLAILMHITAKVDWGGKFQDPTPPK